MPEKSSSSLSGNLLIPTACLWIASLYFPGLVFYSKSMGGAGYSILLMGWIGILGTYVGWYANIFLIIAAFQIGSDNKNAGIKAYLASLCAVVLALDTFRVNCISMGGPCERVYGLGIGGALWLTAVFLLHFAGTVKMIELDNQAEAASVPRVNLKNIFTVAKLTSSLPAAITSVVLLFVFLGFTTYWAIYDRTYGNVDEQKKLNDSLAAFRRSRICEITPKPKNKLVLDGPLQLVTPHSLISVETLLRKGIPVVREGPFDFYLENPGDPKSVAKRDAKGEPSAWLTVYDIGRKLPDADPRWAIAYQAKLASNNDVVGFEQDYWQQYDNVYCPTYSEYGGNSISLGNLVMDALEIKPPFKK